MTGITVRELVDASNAEIDRSARVAADAIVARRVWTACATLLPQLNIRLHAIAGGGCEAGAQRSYLRGQYDLLTRELWEALQLPVPPEFATITTSTEGREETMTEPEETAAEETAEEAETADADEAEADTAEVTE